MKAGRIVGLLALLVLSATGLARAQEAAAIRLPWRLDFKAERFGILHVNEGNSLGSLRWYLLFSVKNSTSEELPLRLAFRIDTDRKKSFVEGYFPKAEASLEAALGKDLVSLVERPRTIAPGQTIEGVAVFGDVDRLAARYDVVVSGLRDVVSFEAGKHYRDKRVLVLSYSQPSDEFEKSRVPIRPLREEWRTEGEKKAF
jgi:hypothetical protein